MAKAKNYLKIRRKELGLTMREVAEQVGVTEATISRWESGQISSMRSENVSAYARALKTTTTFILTGFDGEKIRLNHSLYLLSQNQYPDSDFSEFGNELLGLSNDAVYLGQRFDALTGEEKELIIRIVDLLESKSATKEKATATEIITLPHSLLSASAGTGQWLDYNESEPWKVLLNEHTRKADFAVDVSGDSMEPMFFDGDTVLIHCQPSVNEGEVGLFVYQGNGYIKKQGIDRLISINPEYPDIVPEETEEVKCVGKALGKLESQWIAQ